MGKQVLLIDDDEDIRETLADYLELLGFSVAAAENGQAALDVLAALPELPCFVLLDLMMPVMDGWEFLRAIKPDPKFARVPIFISTSSPGSAPPGYPVIPKPVDLHTVSEAATSVCDMTRPH